MSKGVAYVRPARGPVRPTAINAVPVSRTGTIGTQMTCRPFVSMKVALTRVVPSIVTCTPWYAGPNTSQILAAQANRWARPRRYDGNYQYTPTASYSLVTGHNLLTPSLALMVSPPMSTRASRVVGSASRSGLLRTASMVVFAPTNIGVEQVNVGCHTPSPVLRPPDARRMPPERPIPCNECHDGIDRPAE